MKRIITHRTADADAIAAAWLAEAYLFPGEDVEVVFVPRPRPGQPLPSANCLVDVGCIHDPARLVFDHKPPACADRNATCATRLVWVHLLALGRDLRHLEPLVRVVHEGDRSPPGKPSPELAASRAAGLHFLITAGRARGDGDLQLYCTAKTWLERHDREQQQEHRLVNTREATGKEGAEGDAGPIAASDDVAAAPPAKPRARPRPAGIPLLLGAVASTGRDDLRVLGSALAGYGDLCRRGGMVGPGFDMAVLLSAIAEREARPGPATRATRVLRGLRVLAEVERVAPGHVADRRREAGGWESPLSLAKGNPGREAVDRIAAGCGVEAATVEAEVRLAEAVELIARNCGGDTLALLLATSGRLDDNTIRKIARKGPERQRYAMDEIARGRDPMARPAVGDWPMDTRDFAKVPGRLGRALGQVEACIRDAPQMRARDHSTEGQLADAAGHLAGIVEHSVELSRRVAMHETGAASRGRSAGGPPSQSAESRSSDHSSRATTITQLIGRLDSARYFVEKTARDVPRMPPQTRPTAEQAAKIQNQLQRLDGRARALARSLGIVGLD